MRIAFELEVGLLNRSSVRQQLENSKNKILFWYPGSKVLLTENKDWLGSKFRFEATNIPDKAEAQMREWYNRIKSIANNLN